jgi:hypothetical protein
MGEDGVISHSSVGERQPPDVIAGGARDGRLVAAGDRIRAWRDRWWRDHRGLTLVVLGLVLVLAGGVVGWVRTHRPALAVPGMTVAVDPATVAAAADVQLAVTPDGSQVLAPLVLDVHADPPGNLRLVLQQVTAAGLITQDPTPQPVRGSAQLTVYTVVSCADWHGADGLVADFQLADGTRTQPLPVPLDAASGTLVDTAAQRLCAAWSRAHPLRVTQVVATLDPVQPVIHTTWTVRNTTDQPWRLESGGTAWSDSTPVIPVLPDQVTPVTVPAHRTATVQATLRVTSCLDPTQLTPAGQHLGLAQTNLAAPPTPDFTALDLPSTDVETVFTLARTACQGAPTLDQPVAVLTAIGNETASTLTLDVQAHLQGTGSWTASLQPPPWLLFGPVTTAPVIVRAPGVLDVQLTEPTTGCPSPVGIDTIPLLLTGRDRAYPYLIRVLPPTMRPDTWCSVRH